MELEYKGGDCIVVSVKKTQLVVDPKLSDLGLKDQGTKAAVQLLTQPSFAAPAAEGALIIDGPGEYEVDDISIKGIAAQAHTDAKEEHFSATMYRLSAAGLSLAIVGHIHPDLSEDQLEELGIADVLVVPIGGNGYTLDATGAVKIVRAVDPKIVVPTHFAQEGVTYPVSQAELDLFVKELGAPKEESNKLKLKAGTLGEAALTIYQIQRTA